MEISSGRSSVGGRAPSSGTICACPYRSYSLAASCFQEEYMNNPNNQRRAIGLLLVFATVLTLIAMWDLPETQG